MQSNKFQIKKKVIRTIEIQIDNLVDKSCPSTDILRPLIEAEIKQHEQPQKFKLKINLRYPFTFLWQ